MEIVKAREAARERYDMTRPGVAENFTVTDKGRALDKLAAAVGTSRGHTVKFQMKNERQSP